MYPQADIPLARVSVLRGATPAEHVWIDHALSTLCDEGVLAD
jgi:4,5-DOPA dioxygenase extradiol